MTNECPRMIHAARRVVVVSAILTLGEYSQSHGTGDLRHRSF